MQTTTTFETSTGTTWSICGASLTRVRSRRAEPAATFFAVPNGRDDHGHDNVVVRVGGVVTFVDGLTVMTTGRIRRILRVTSAAPVA